ncbi:hypothetical protein AMS68_000455 [Peltaster fructicola]|uniref:Uncharacterized protein n=1 Tax=Peltaster fructicola TaxID=286661 RepID=A0A6H0XJX7_9PEZI|nr:hypothetical protein AMS68_000455 [Peltaster fructicola]
MSKDQLESLEKAQQEINRVLELLGRLFVAAKGSNRATAIATATRLKQNLPATTRNYHEALDELDQQLQYAKLVLRRDLAIATEKSNAPVEAQPVSTPAKSVKDEPAVQADAVKPEPVSQDEELQPLKVDSDSTGINESESKQDLKLDTTQESQHDTKDTDELGKGSDTAVSNNADMDSLFNDPVSAGGLQGDGSGASASFDFANDADASNDFDFGEFAAGLDASAGEDIATIPGLQDFTADSNTTGTAEPDFSALFSNASASQTVANESQAADEFNFDDMMDFGVGTDHNASLPDADNEFSLDFS